VVCGVTSSGEGRFMNYYVSFSFSLSASSYGYDSCHSE
jgi:hypothetical protein